MTKEQKNKTKILYLYKEVMPYNLPVLEKLVEMGADIIFVHDNTKKLTPYNPEAIEGVSFHKMSELNNQQIKDLALKFDPDIIFISDRTVPIYNKIGIKFKKSIPVISGNDTPWYGGKQWFNVLTSIFRHHRFFSHMLVAGIRQFEYAKKLGFKNQKISWPLYSADTKTFEKLELSKKRFDEAKDILFVGRFNKVKGIDYLIEGWSKVQNKNNGKLHLVGNGDYLNNLNVADDIIIHDFSNQDYLAELAFKCKAFILPSTFEPWGVVVHEFAAAGLPLIISNVCGSSPHFIKNAYNGYTINKCDSDEIQKAITKILSMSSSELLTMGTRSRELSKSINPELVASAVLSCIKE